MHLLLCGHGYLGQAVSRDFLAAGWDVTALSRSGDDGSIACDLSSAADVASLQAKPDFIVHCASSGRGGADDLAHFGRAGVARRLSSRSFMPAVAPFSLSAITSSS